jgi:hypothetical protein
METQFINPNLLLTYAVVIITGFSLFALVTYILDDKKQ